MDYTKEGLLSKYNITKANGWPVDKDAKYFVLRYDKDQKDQAHAKACQLAMMTYAEAIKNDIPKLSQDIFSTVEAPSENLSFGQALIALKNRCRVARKGWNGKNMYIFIEQFDNCDPVICMKTAQGTIQPGWLASQPDMLANDWEIIAYVKG